MYRPLFTQFCGNDPDTVVAAARHVEAHTDYVDINFGCPQRIARRGRYGAFLMDDLEAVEQLVRNSTACNLDCVLAGHITACWTMAGRIDGVLSLRTCQPHFRRHRSSLNAGPLSAAVLSMQPFSCGRCWSMSQHRVYILADETCYRSSTCTHMVCCDQVRGVVAGLTVPVTAKIRIFPELERTLAYARMLQAGISLQSGFSGL